MKKANPIIKCIKKFLFGEPSVDDYTKLILADKKTTTLEKLDELVDVYSDYFNKRFENDAIMDTYETYYEDFVLEDGSIHKLRRDRIHEENRGFLLGIYSKGFSDTFNSLLKKLDGECPLKYKSLKEITDSISCDFNNAFQYSPEIIDRNSYESCVDNSKKFLDEIKKFKAPAAKEDASITK
ncbi:MAG: hypothetical protein IJ008_02390 [Clostridia bacterium]|nr:hypothetical protein [Clostridia bacterium]